VALMTVNQAALERMLATARDAGCTPDQVQNFINAGYVPLKKAWAFHAAARLADNPGGPVEIGLGGSRGPGKSHSSFAQVVLDDCQRRAGLKFLFLRNIKLSAEESFEDLIAKVLVGVPHRYAEGVLHFPNSSRVHMGGFRHEGDIEKFIGIEYDGVVVEEATTISETKLNLLYGSIRTSRLDWRPRKYLTFNPGGIGHQYIKKRFITPYRMRQQTDTRFFPGTYRDNPFLDAEYIRYLEGLRGPLGKAWRDGDWDIFSGQVFPEWNEEKHVIRPFEIPDNWARWRAVDYGFVHPFTCHWFAKDPANGRVYVYREVAHRLLADKFQARTIRDETPPDEHISITYASPDMWARESKEDDGTITTPAGNYKAAGVLLTKADNHRINGVRRLHSLLADLPDGKPGLQIFDTCPRLIECLPAMLSDPNNPEDVLKVDADPATGEGGDDEYDSLRYGLTNINVPALRVLPRRQQSPLASARRI